MIVAVTIVEDRMIHRVNVKNWHFVLPSTESVRRVETKIQIMKAALIFSSQDKRMMIKVEDLFIICRLQQLTAENKVEV